MYYSRLIPCLLLQNQGLVKTKQFKKPIYIGDPINAVRIFNEKEVDELIFIDIDATREGRRPNIEYLKKITDRCFMPLCYGGGITSTDEMGELFRIGFEKVSLNTLAYRKPEIIRSAVELYGSQSIVGSMDVISDFFGKQFVAVVNGKINTKRNPVQYAKYLDELGVGEILINSVANDGMMQGYDFDLIESVTHAVSVPVTVCGGAGKLDDCKKAIDKGASAAAVGSMFVFWGNNKAVLINYPDRSEIEKVFNV